jgi:hypothetical protein
MLKLVRFLCLVLLLSPLAYLGYMAASPSVMEVNLWNGNKTSARQDYERAVLQAAMDVTRERYGEWQLLEDVRDLPAAEDEAGVFRNHRFDVFGTVAGNPKLEDEQKRVVPIPIMNGLLGYRVLIIRAEEQARFAAITSAEPLQQLRLGIPATWADAGLFRHNGYRVEEKSSFDELFARQLAGEFDYVSFGANEIDSVFNERAAPAGGLAIENSLLLYYPFPVVFYVNPTKTLLAERLTAGLQIMQESGELERLFNQFHGDLVKRLRLRERHLIILENPLLPAELADFQSTLLSIKK